MSTFNVNQTTSSGSVFQKEVTVLDTVPGNVNPVAGVSVQVIPSGFFYTLIFTLASVSLVMTKNGTTSAGGGVLLYTFRKGLVLPFGGATNLTVVSLADASYLASVGSAAADTSGTLTTTEISYLPSTAATTSSLAGTCKMKSTVTTPTPGTPLDGTSTPNPLYLNSCLNADGTGKETLVYSGTITVCVAHLGDNG